MEDIIILIGMIGLGIGGFLMGTAVIVLIVAICIADTIRQRKMLVLAGKFLLAGILLFAVGFGSCVLLFNL